MLTFLTFETKRCKQACFTPLSGFSHDLTICYVALSVPVDSPPQVWCINHVWEGTWGQTFLVLLPALY